MPHFFFSINWFVVPLIIMAALAMTTALIYWAAPNLSFISSPAPSNIPARTWFFISGKYSLV